MDVGPTAGDDGTASEELAAVVGSLVSIRDSLRRKDPDRPELVRGEDLIHVVDHLLEVTERLAEVTEVLQAVTATAHRADQVSAAVAAAVKPTLTKKQRRKLKKARRLELD